MAERRPYATVVVVALMAVGSAGGARADGPLGSQGGERGGLRLSVDALGGGTTSLFGGVTDPGRETMQIAVHAHLPLIEGRRFALDYTGGVVPVELALGTRVAGPETALGSPPLARTVYGAGVDGLGLTARFGGDGRWEPYLMALGGVRLFTEPVPNPRGIRFNFSADLGAGVALRLGSGRRLKVGLTLHHLSNGGLGQANPSFNGFGFTVGLEGLRGRTGLGRSS